jgi:hypothetical protein
MSAIHPRAVALASLLASLAGCAGLQNGPHPTFATDELGYQAARSAIREAITRDCLGPSAPQALAAAGAVPAATAVAAGNVEPESAEERRNRLVTAYVFAVDVAYNEYERNLLDAVRENDTGAATASLGLSAIASVIGIPNLARALDTTNAIVTGTHTAIGRDYLINQTLTTLQTQMRASRDTQRALILRRLGLRIDQWSSCTALSDALAFEQAGTLNAAIAAVSASAARENRTAQQLAQDAIPSAEFESGPLGDALLAYLDANNADFQARRTRALEAMALLRLGEKNDLLRLSVLVNGAGFDVERRALITMIALSERAHNRQAADDLEAALRR